MRRSLTLTLTTLYGLGNILGAGIYVLIGKVVGHAGPFAPVSFLVAALLACLTAFSYAELSARYPLSAGEAVYIEEGLGIRQVSVLVGLLIIFAGVVSAAAILRGFTGYLQVLLDIPGPVAITGMVLLLGGLAAWGIVQSVVIAALITLVEISGLVLVVAVALPQVSVEDLSMAWKDMPPGIDAWQGILVGGFLAFYAFIGFEDMVNVAEEVRDPRRNLPRAILLALGISVLLYFMVALVAVTAVPTDALAAAEAPLAWLYRQVTGREPVVITLISLFAVINGALIQIIMAARVTYGMGRKHWLPAVFACVSAVTCTPVFATVCVSVAVLLLALWLPIETLAKATSYFLLLVFCLVNLSLWRIKRVAERPGGIINVPGWIPVAGLSVTAGFVAFQALTDLSSL